MVDARLQPTDVIAHDEHDPWAFGLAPPRSTPAAPTPSPEQRPPSRPIRVFATISLESPVWLALPAQEGFNSPTTHSLGPMVNRARGPLFASAFLSVGAALSQRDASRVAPGTFGRPKNRGAIRGLPRALERPARGPAHASLVLPHGKTRCGGSHEIKSMAVAHRRRAHSRISDLGHAARGGPCPDGEAAQHRHADDRRHGLERFRRLFRRRQGARPSDAERRQDRRGRRDLHQLVRTGELHGGPRIVHDRTHSGPLGALDRRCAGRPELLAQGNADDRRILPEKRLCDLFLGQVAYGRHSCVLSDRARL